MVELKNIKQIFNRWNISKLTGGANRKRDLFNTARDWKIIFSVFVVTVLISALFSIYLFLQTSQGEIFIVHRNNVSLDTINRTLLDDTLSFFENKERRFIEMSENKPRFVDPSL